MILASHVPPVIIMIIPFTATWNFEVVESQSAQEHPSHDLTIYTPFPGFSDINAFAFLFTTGLIATGAYGVPLISIFTIRKILIVTKTHAKMSKNTKHQARVLMKQHQLKNRVYVEIEAVHLVDTPLGIQIVHAVVPLSDLPLELAMKRTESVWYIPDQQEFPKIAYLTSHGWYFLDEKQFDQIQRKEHARKAPKNAQLDVTSLVRLVPSTFKHVQFIKKGSLGAYIYSDDMKRTQFEAIPSPSTRATETQMIKTGNLAAYIYSEVPEPQVAGSGSESLYWLIPAVSTSSESRAYTTRLHDSSLLLYYGMPRLIKLKA
uniref:Uncharacterized protein n=1 Tax=Caenorhabditis japonica TaxID=281687 RepID=A0A8R1DYG8_CAEJA